LLITCSAALDESELLHNLKLAAAWHGPMMCAGIPCQEAWKQSRSPQPKQRSQRHSGGLCGFHSGVNVSSHLAVAGLARSPSVWCRTKLTRRANRVWLACICRVLQPLEPRKINCKRFFLAQRNHHRRSSDGGRLRAALSPFLPIHSLVVASRYASQSVDAIDGLRTAS
jgi:hypothetical protein